MRSIDTSLLVRSSDVVFVEPLNSVSVVHSHEWSRRSLEFLSLWVSSPKLIDKCLRLGFRDHSIDSLADLAAKEKFSINRNEGKGKSETHEFFDVFQKFVEIDESEFTLDVSVLTQVTTSVRFLSTERFLNTEDVSQTRQASFEVELGRLSEVGLFSIVIESEESCSSFDLRLNHARGGVTSRRLRLA